MATPTASRLSLEEQLFEWEVLFTATLNKLKEKNREVEEKNELLAKKNIEMQETRKVIKSLKQKYSNLQKNRLRFTDYSRRERA